MPVKLLISVKNCIQAEQVTDTQCLPSACYLICIYCKRTPPSVSHSDCLHQKGSGVGCRELPQGLAAPHPRLAAASQQAKAQSCQRALLPLPTCRGRQCQHKFSCCGTLVTSSGTPCRSSTTPLLLLPALFAHLLLAERRFCVRHLPEQSMARINTTCR